MNLQESLVQIVGEHALKTKEPMMRHTTFRIGGPADYFVTPGSIMEIQKIAALCRDDQIPYVIIGNGSNLLVGDRGYRGVVIALDRNYSEYQTEPDGRIRAQSGILLSSLAGAALQQHLSGLEFASGIPGTLGGAVTMNAGAYGGEMKDVIESALVMTQEGELLSLSNEALELGYRSSIVMKEQYIVLEAVLRLTPGNPEKIAETMRELNQRRKEKQPLEYPSAGSTFKRPEGYFAGKLIQDAGLAGYRVGDAAVSEKHCGFVINLGNATAAEVQKLIREIQEKVLQDSGVMLEPEVKMIGE